MNKSVEYLIFYTNPTRWQLMICVAVMIKQYVAQNSFVLRCYTQFNSFPISQIRLGMEYEVYVAKA